MILDAGARTCAETGLRLLPVEGDRMFRVAPTRYNALSAPARAGTEPRHQWGRFDSPGLTLYAAQTPETAYAEVLSQFKRPLGADDPLAADARAIGMSRDDFLEVIADEWAASSFMGVGAVPASWRHDRGMCVIHAEPGGWWIDVDHPDTISRLELAMEALLVEEGVTTLTTAVLEGENRRITTTIGELLRRVELDDGTQARGLQFHSKHGGAWCRAVWLPGPGDGWSAELTALSPERILVSDESLARACERFRIRAF